VSVEREQRGGVTVLKVDGDLAEANARQLRILGQQALLEGRQELLVDLSGANACDSAGLESLTWLQRECQEQLGLVHLTGVGRTFHKILELTRLKDVFQYAPAQAAREDGHE
jgi:anti-anti-sigma factor